MIGASGADALEAGPIELGADELVVVVGPTASGKSDLALRLAAALDGEIVSADSVQVYRGFDLASGKPTAAERAAIRHHLIDVREADDPLDAAEFAALADRAIEEIRARGRRPIVCGGTFLWVKALVYGLMPSAPKDEALRARHKERAAREGRAALHAELAEKDPESAKRLAPNDLVRVSRALEIFELTGKRQSELIGSHGFREVRHAARLLGVRREREELDRRIEARVQGWIELGVVDEVRGLIARGLGETRAMGSVGYAEVRAHLRGELSASALPAEIVKKTRVLVRRQRTWLRDQPVTWLSPGVSPGRDIVASR